MLSRSVDSSSVRLQWHSRTQAFSQPDFLLEGCEQCELPACTPQRSPPREINHSQMEGQSVVRSAIGGMGHNIQDLRLLTKTMLDVQPWILDPNVVPLPWRQGLEDETRKKIASKKLRFGVIRSDGMVQPHPPVARAVDEAVKALVAKGYEVLQSRLTSFSNTADPLISGHRMGASRSCRSIRNFGM